MLGSAGRGQLVPLAVPLGFFTILFMHTSLESMWKQGQVCLLTLLQDNNASVVKCEACDSPYILRDSH
jgi:hypothetical protein